MSEMMHEGPGFGEPLEDEWVHADDETVQGADDWSEMHPIPVRVKETESQNVAPDSVALGTWAVPLIPQAGGTGALQPQQICPHRYKRYKAKFLVQATGAGILYIAKDPNTLMSSALANAFQVQVPVTTQSIPIIPDYDGQQPLYVMASVVGMTIAVMDEGFKTVQ